MLLLMKQCSPNVQKLHRSLTQVVRFTEFVSKCNFHSIWTGFFVLLFVKCTKTTSLTETWKGPDRVKSLSAKQIFFKGLNLRKLILNSESATLYVPIDWNLSSIWICSNEHRTKISLNFAQRLAKLIAKLTL